jgi:uncharacterized Ntn-hydrolase superfamily protein
MTFSIAGRCGRTGMFGIAIATSSICVASRCSWARAGAGAVLTQNLTDPGLGPQGLDLLAKGCSASEVIRGLIRGNKYAAFRQLATIDREGRTSHYSGEKTLGIHRVAEGEDCVAVGNLLANGGIPGEMVETFRKHSFQPLANRLLLAVERGLEAGGEKAPVKSAGLLVVHDRPWPLVDLRVDWHQNPLRILRELWEEYEPRIQTFLLWALSPDRASLEDNGI